MILKSRRTCVGFYVVFSLRKRLHVRSVLYCRRLGKAFFLFLSLARLQRSFFFCRRLNFRDIEFLPRRDMRRHFRSASDYTRGAFHIVLGLIKRFFFFCRRLIFRDLEFLPRRDMKRNFRFASVVACEVFYIAVGSFSAFFILIYVMSEKKLTNILQTLQPLVRYAFI